MARPAQSPERVTFADFTFDFRTLALSRHATAVKLQPQPAKVLAVLIQRAGEIVTAAQRNLLSGLIGNQRFGFNSGKCAV